MNANEWHLRVLASTTDHEVEKRIAEALSSIFEGCSCYVAKMQPYWKFDGWGELVVTVRGIEDIEAVKSRLAVRWIGDVASKRWTDFCDDAIMFLWLSEQ